MAAGDYIIQGAQSVTERGIGFVNSCGEAALAVIQGIANGSPPTIAQVINLVKQGTQFGTAASGTSTPNELAQLGAATGTPLTIGPGGQGALTTINANLARGVPTELNIQNARAFGGSDSGVSGHYITIVGKAASGNFIVADPNQTASLSGGFVQYSPQQILNAQPYATLTPTNGASAAFGNPFSGLSGSAFGGLFAAFGTDATDFAWRAGLILGGGVLMILGLMVFFSHQEGSVIDVVTSSVGKAASAVATGGGG